MYKMYRILITEISVLKLKECMLQCHTFFVIVKSWIRKVKKLWCTRIKIYRGSCAVYLYSVSQDTVH